MKTKINIFIVLAVIAFTLSASGTFAQEAAILQAGPSGMFVFLGKNIPNGNPVGMIRVERKTGTSDWKEVAQVKLPSDLATFLTMNGKNHELFPHAAIPEPDRLGQLYREAEKKSVIDSLILPGTTLAERLTLGNIFFDPGITAASNVQYRVSQVNRTGGIISQVVSVSSLRVVPAIMDTASVAGIAVTGKGIFLKWMSVGQHPPYYFSVFRIVNDQPVACDGNTGHYSIHDTTWYLFEMAADTSMLRGGLVFFMETFDRYENPGPVSEPALVDPVSFDRIYFTAATAEQASGQLGINLSWNLSSTTGVRAIEIWRSNSFDKDFTLLAKVSGAESSYFDPGIIPDKVTYYYLVAKGRYPFQSAGSTVFFDVGLDPATPVPPVITKGYPLEKGVGLVIRGNGHFLAGVMVYRRSIRDTLWSQISTVIPLEGDSLVFRDTSSVLSGSMFYEYAATAENTSHKISGMSNIVRVNPGIPVYPAPPTRFQAYYEDGVARLFWEDMSVAENTIIGYLLYRAEAGKDGSAAAMTARDKPLRMIESSNFYTDSTVVPGMRYIYYVRSVDIFGHEGREEAIASVDIPDNLPIPPAGLTGVKTPTGVVLEWGPAVMKDLAYYKIYRYQRGMKPEMIKLTAGTVTTYTDNTGAPGQLYFYYLTSIDNKDMESGPGGEVGILW